MLESKIEKRLKRKVEDICGLSLKFTSPGMAGVPDRFVLLPKGRIYFVETKSTGDRPRKRQLLVHRLLRGLGFSVDVIDDMEGLERFYEKITK